MSSEDSSNNSSSGLAEKRPSQGRHCDMCVVQTSDDDPVPDPSCRQRHEFGACRVRTANSTAPHPRDEFRPIWVREVDANR